MLGRVTSLKDHGRNRPRLGRWLIAVLIAALLAGLFWPPVTNGIKATRVLMSQWFDLARMQPQMRSQVCAHRANTVARFRLAGWLFDCVEIDVVVTPAVANVPSVYHPPDSNYLGLSLEQLLHDASLPKGALWLDVKDLGEDNWRTLLALLHELVPVERRPSVVVETGWADEAVAVPIDAFRRSGFQVSYYLPTERAFDCAALASMECQQFRAEVLRTVSFGFSHLSFDARGYEFVRTIRNQLPGHVRLLTWHTARMLPQEEMLGDVDLYIVKFRTPLDP